ncbi:MAG: phage portal protein, partial [Clostridiales bacterium]|nr:phage portal protein [Clostridiales bacterium]
MSFLTRLQNGWNAFIGRDPTMYRPIYNESTYGGYSSRPDRTILTRGNERSIVNAVYNRIANDDAQINLLHAELDANGKYVTTIDDDLNKCLT